MSKEKKKDITIIIVPPEQQREEDYTAPRANWWFKDALGNTVFVRCTDKVRAQKHIDEEYGANKYKLQACKLKKPEGEISVRGSMNSKSRSGAYMQQIKSSQGRGL